MSVFERGRKLLRDRHDKQNLVAFALRGRRIVSVGHNSYTRTHPEQSRLAKKVGQPDRQFLHAEVAALLKAPRDADTLVVVRINKQGELVNASPCPVCREAIRLFNPKMKVFHS